MRRQSALVAEGDHEPGEILNRVHTDDRLRKIEVGVIAADALLLEPVSAQANFTLLKPVQ